MNKIFETFNAPLSNEIKKAYNILIDTLTKISPKERTKKIIEGTGGTVSVADIIAYQIGWGKLLIEWYEAGIQNKKIIMPGEGFTTWDYTGLAQHFYNKYHYDAAEKQLNKFYETVSTIIAIVETEYKNNNLDKVGIWDWCTLKSGKTWPLSKWIRINTVAPYKKATTMLNKFFKNN